MNWLESLSQTYDNCFQNSESNTDPVPLAPVAHTVQNTHIVISLDESGNLLDAKTEPKLTVIPCSESSSGRTSAPAAHPLADKLQYVAADFHSLTGVKTSKNSSHHQSYLEALKSWSDSSYGDPKLNAILRYLKGNRGMVLADLCNHGVYALENGNIPKSWKGDKESKPPIYEATKNSTAPWDAFVRWVVNIPGDLEPRTAHDRNLWAKWQEYYSSHDGPMGLCYVTGLQSRLATSHPKKIRSAADGSKLISANDSSGFTFRGRFTDPDGLQTCGLGFNVTQKAHNALRWLIARQGRKYGEQAIVAWAINGKAVPDALVSTANLFDDDEFEVSDINLINSSLSTVNTGQIVANALKSKLSGYRADLGNTTGIVVLSLDSATPGRMAISYYRELTSSEFLERIEIWHTQSAWLQNFGKEKKFIGAPSPLEIAQTAYGRRLDDSLKAATHRRLLPCIIENQPLPADLVTSCINRATNRQSQDHWEWGKALGIACSLYRKQQSQTNNNHYAMSLERNRTTRSYLYGRLLAVADILEQTALRAAGENRDTNAARLMQRFASRPYETWQNIYLSLDSYRRRLKANSPGLLHRYESEIEEIKNLFQADEFCKPGHLEGEFLLAYHCQRSALFEKAEKITTAQES